MAIVHCKDIKHRKIGSTSQFCFVNANGQHLDPRACLCHTAKYTETKGKVNRVLYQPAREDRFLKNFPHLAAKYNVATMEGLSKTYVTKSDDEITALFIEGCGQRVITIADHVIEMKKKYRKHNPACPIEDEHEPIDPWSR